MSQSVNKLKELLFDAESRALVDLEHRVERVAKTGADNLSEVSKRLDVVFARSGTESRFKSSVANVLDGALREAEVERHTALSDAVAPLVVRTIKTEIINSQDELVEALYPMTGRMVQAYVASAIKDLTSQINRTLERNPLMLRINSLMTGRSMAELALADAQKLEVDELYLIRRGTGELIARWPHNASSSNRDQVMSGILTAINDFATEAFQSDGAALRQIDLGDAQVYLRGSPTYLLAAKCTGTATAAVEKTIDAEFLSAIETHHDLGKSTTGPNSYNVELENDEQSPRVLATLATSLTEKINTYYDENAAATSGTNPAKYVFWTIGLAFAAWLAWTLTDAFLTHRTHAKAEHVIATNDDMAGYPVNIHTASFGGAVSVEGLAPSMGVKHNVIEGLYEILPSARIIDNLTVVNSNYPDLTPQLTGLNSKIDGLKSDVTNLDSGITTVRSSLTGVESNLSNTQDRIQLLNLRLNRETLARAATRAAARLRASLPVLSNLAENLNAGPAQDRISKAQTILNEVLPQIENHRASALNPNVTSETLLRARPQLAEISMRIDRAAQLISPVLKPDLQTSGVDAPSASNSAATIASRDTSTANLAAYAETLSISAEHFATLATATSQAALMKPPPARVATPREKLEAWTRANAIFFAKGTDFANSSKAREKLRTLARLARDARSLVRVVGFTDEKGAQTRNSTLSLSRAQRVSSVLRSNGIRANMLSTVGREDTQEISTNVGEASPNRRVEFELGFIGERSK